ncbi:multifunctional procollagen lysine hydroxylase and glycosyltransferase LH3 isoform X2 [Patagioenas fasciata]|uniref:multifunctional procollagen lysine hydroxylase and glycosyltransferase LH3 isoform X2 n=1 Tax=Patagioenas fasciata TaxID=372321 RepID=UPI003A992EA5
MAELPVRAPRALLPLLPVLLGVLLPPAGSRGPPGPEQLLVLTVATEATDGYERFLRSAKRFNYSVQTLGLGQAWRGGDVAHTVGGGQKVRWLKSAMAPLRTRQDLLVLFVDSYDVVFAGGPRELLEQFWGAGGGGGGVGVLFSAEGFCWPQEELAASYPPPPAGGKAFLNSGGFLGFAPAVWRLVERWRFRDDDDDQLFYTRLYLNPHIRDELGLALDHHSRIFQNLNGALDEVVLKFQPGGVRVRNVVTDSLPMVIHGNGPTKLQLNYLGNYVPSGWSYEGGCGDCDLDLRPLEGVPVPQLLSQVTALWPRLLRHFASAQLVGPQEGLGGDAARDMGMSLCRRDPQCQHYLSLDGDVTLSHPGTLRALLRQNRKVLAPLLSRPGQLWSNFWGALSPDGYYARSQDYVDIVQGKRRGVWNVPYISHAYLVSGAALRGPLGDGAVFTRPDTDPDMAFCRHARQRGLFLHVTNREEFGHLLVTSGYNSSRRHPDLWELPRNPRDWEDKYLHQNYSRIFQENLYQEPCPDVYQFPFFSEEFCQELLDEVEDYGKWSQDHHEGGAQAVALGLLGLEPVWLGALRRFLTPVTRKFFPGYQPKGRAVLSDVIRYGPRPSAPPTPARGPAATISLSLSLSPPQGGGWHFPRYNCGVPAPPPGWALLHPGRLTHPRHLLSTPGGTHHVLLTLLDP